MNNQNPNPQFVSNEEKAKTTLLSLEQTNDGNEIIGEPKSSQPPEWQLALRVLRELLDSNDGCISTTALRRELERHHGVEDAHPLVVELKFFDPETARERG